MLKLLTEKLRTGLYKVKLSESQYLFGQDLEQLRLHLSDTLGQSVRLVSGSGESWRVLENKCANNGILYGEDPDRLD